MSEMAYLCRSVLFQSPGSGHRRALQRHYMHAPEVTCEGWEGRSALRCYSQCMPSPSMCSRTNNPRGGEAGGGDRVIFWQTLPRRPRHDPCVLPHPVQTTHMYVHARTIDDTQTPCGGTHESRLSLLQHRGGRGGCPAAGICWVWRGIRGTHAAFPEHSTLFRHTRRYQPGPPRARRSRPELQEGRVQEVDFRGVKLDLVGTDKSCILLLFPRVCR